MSSYTTTGWAGTVTTQTTATVTGAYNSSRTAAVTVLSAPVLHIVKTHTGSFVQGQNGTYTVTVSNTSATAATSGQVTVTETLPPGMTMVSQSGPGWSCVGTVCSRSDSLSPVTAYPAITVTVNVASNATLGPAVNTVTVSGGGAVAQTTNDTVIIVIPSSAPVWASLTPNTGTGTPGQAQTFTVTFTDANGATDITDMELLFNGSPLRSSACWVVYSGGGFHLYNDQGNAWTDAGSGSVSNSQCTLNGGASSVNFAGTTATMNVNVRFLENQFSGLKYTYTYASDTTSLNTGSIFVAYRGSWTVVAPVAVSVTPFVGVYVALGHTQMFTASVTGTANTNVTWSLPVGVGSGVGTLGVPSGNNVTYAAPDVLPGNTTVEVRATSVADPTKYASSFITILPYNPSGLTLLSILPINSSGSRQQFTFGVADSAGAADVTWLQPFFSATFPLNTGAGGCHMIFYPTSGNPSTGVVYLDGAAGGSSWSAGSSAVGAGGIDLSNGLCTVHAGSSSISWGGINYYLTLDVQFQGTELGTEKFDYLSAGNAALPNGTDWLYFGWWY
jgi:uncharacterized repeat protein (TIGR01451 family)